MRILTLDDDDLVINDEIIKEAEYVIELEAGEIIADFDQFHEEMLHDQSYADFNEMGSIDEENTVFVRIIDLTENLDESQLNECAFYMDQPGGFAYEIVDRDSE